LGDKVLRALWRASAATAPNPPISRLLLSVADLSGALVYCERDRIDITVQIPDLRLMFVIENKIDASERQDQLKDYRALAARRYPGYAFMGCFLTPSGYSGNDEEWAPLSYGVIAGALKEAIGDEASTNPVTITAQHYIDLIEKEIMASDELITACRRIYAQHRAAFNLIVQHGQAPVLAEAFQAFQSERPDLLTLSLRARVVEFVASSWLQIPGFQIADTTRWAASCPIKFWFERQEKKLLVFLEAGPVSADSGFPRSQFVEQLGGRVSKNGKGIYTRLHRHVRSLAEDADVDTVKRAIDELWEEVRGTYRIEEVRNAALHCLGS
jgi:hypothetical protein